MNILCYLQKLCGVPFAYDNKEVICFLNMWVQLEEDVDSSTSCHMCQVGYWKSPSVSTRLSERIEPPRSWGLNIVKALRMRFPAV